MAAARRRIATLITGLGLACGCSSPEMPKVVEPEWLHSASGVPVDNCGPQRPRFPSVIESTFGGVIVPKEYPEKLVASVGSASKVFGYTVDGFWTPTPQDVLRAEQRVRAALAEARQNFAAVAGPQKWPPSAQTYAMGEIEKIVVNLAKFDAQYAGVIIGGQKRILCNFMRRESGAEHFVGNSRMCQWVQVSDGGFWYWQIQYDCATDTCLGFESNGYA